MPGNFLLDTNIAIGFIRAEQAALEHMARSDEAYICGIVLGELYYGAFNSHRIADNLAVLDRLARRNTIIQCDLATTRLYGSLKAGLRAKGRMIPENDIWIAAITIQSGLILATRDSDFANVDGLQYEVW